MRKIITLILGVILFSSCVTNYYSVVIDEDTIFYKRNNAVGENVNVSAGTIVYLSDRYYKNNYKKIKFNDRFYWSSGFVYSTPSTDYSKSNYSESSSSNIYKSNSSSYKSKTVNVKGYYRKNGNYVKPHTRSSPRRR